MLKLLFIVFTPVVHASVDTFIHKLNQYLLNPIIIFLFILAVCYFIYGIFEYLNGGESGDARETGQRHMMWGLIGLFIMVAVFYILKVLLGTLGIDENQINPTTGEVNISTQ
jgi:uncharacterized membrane protein YidH (DUF202 family)